jgi:hypothetical protein
MPTVADVSPPKPILPAVPPRLLSSASAPALAPAPPTCLTIEDISIAPSTYNPEADPLYQETWDAYWARVRPQRSRPYSKSHPQAPRPKIAKGGCLVVVVYLSYLLVRGGGKTVVMRGGGFVEGGGGWVENRVG